MSETNKYAIGSVVFFLCSVIIAGLTYFYISQEGEKLEQQVQVVGENNLMQERFNDLLQLLKEHEEEHEALNSHLLTEGKTINFLNEIETTARNMGLKYSTDALEVEPLSNPQFQSINLKMRANGEYRKLINFLHMIETLPYFSYINDLRLEAVSGSDNWSANVTLVVGLTSYDKEE